MSRIITVAFASLSLALVAGCQKSDESMKTALKRIDDRLKSIEDKLDRGGGAGAGAAGAGAARPTARGKERGRRGRPPGPDPQAVYSVPVEGAAYVGPKNAKVTVVKAFEFACPFCLRVKPTLEQLLNDYKGDLKVVYKHLIVHPGSATVPAQAACAAQKQGKFLPMYEGIWEKGFNAGRNLSEDNMVKIAGDIGLNVDKFKQDMNGDECKKQVASDQQQLRRVGARGTPAFFINGRFLSGARPIDQFKKIVDEELKKANDRIKKGTSVADYYNEWVLKKGKKSL